MSIEPTAAKRGAHYHADRRERNAKATALIEGRAAADPEYGRRIWPLIELGLDEHRAPKRSRAG